METETETDEISVIEPPSASNDPALPPRSCCIGGCSSSTEKSKIKEHLLLMPTPSVSFHKLPSLPFGLRQAWINIIRASRSEPEWMPDDNVFVCNRHFHPHEIVIPVDETTAQIDFSDGKNIVPSLRLGDYGVTKILDNDDEDDNDSQRNGSLSLDNDINILKADSSFNFIPMKIKEEPKSEDEYEDSSFNNTFDDEQSPSSSSIIKPGKRKPKPTWSLRELWDDEEERNEQEENDSSEYEPSSDSDSEPESGNESKPDDDFNSKPNSSKRPKLSSPNPNQKFILQSSSTSANKSLSSCTTPKTHQIHRTGIVQKQLNFRTGNQPFQNKLISANLNPTFLNFQLNTHGLQNQVVRSPGTQFLQINRTSTPVSASSSNSNAALAKKRILMPYYSQSDPNVGIISLMQQIQTINRAPVRDLDFYDQCISIFNQIFDRLKQYPPSEAKKNISLQLSVLVDIAKQRKSQGNSTANQVHFSLVSKKILELLSLWPKDPQYRPPSKPVTPSSSSPNIRVSANHVLQAVQKSTPSNPNFIPSGSPSLHHLQQTPSGTTATAYGHMTKVMDNKFILNSGDGKVRVTPIQDISKTTNLLSSKNLQNLKNMAAAAASPPTITQLSSKGNPTATKIPSTSNLKPMPTLTPKSSNVSTSSHPPEVVTLDSDDDDDGFAPLIESVTTLAPSALVLPSESNLKQKLPNLLPSPQKTQTSTPNKSSATSNISNNRRSSTSSTAQSSDNSPLKIVHSSTVLEKFALFTKFVLSSEVPRPLSPTKSQSIPWMGHDDSLDDPNDPDGHDWQSETQVTAGMIAGAASQLPTLPLGKYPPNVPIVVSSVPKDQNQTKQSELFQHQNQIPASSQKASGNVTASSIAAGIRHALKMGVSQNQINVQNRNVTTNGQIFTSSRAVVTGIPGTGAGRFPAPRITPVTSVSSTFSEQLRNLAAHSVQSNGQSANRLVSVSSSGSVSGSASVVSGQSVKNDVNLNNKRIMLVSQSNGQPAYALISNPSQINSSMSSPIQRLPTTPVLQNQNPNPNQLQQQGLVVRSSVVPPTTPTTSVQTVLQKTSTPVVQKKVNPIVDEIILLSDDSDEEGQSQSQSKNTSKNENTVKPAHTPIAPKISAPIINCVSLNSNINKSNNVIGPNTCESGASASLNYFINNPNDLIVTANANSSFPAARVEDQNQSVCEEEMLLGI